MAEIFSPVEIEVHREKGNIRCDVPETKPFIKLDTVKYGDRITVDTDMLEVEIAVTVLDVPFLLPDSKE